jgi:hypothetical protein
LTPIPVYWGNRFWSQEAKQIKPGELLPDGHPQFIQYDQVKWDTRSLSAEGEPERPFRLQLHRQIIDEILSQASGVPPH